MKNQKNNKTIAKINQNTMSVRHRNEPKIKILLRIAAKSCALLDQHLGFPNKMPYGSCDWLQYFFELDLGKFMKGNLNSYLTLVGNNIITRGWG